MLVASISCKLYVLRLNGHCAKEIPLQLDIFKPKAPPLFGLDISSSSVKMLEIVDAGKGAYRVERYALEPLPRDPVADCNIQHPAPVHDAVKPR